MHRIVQVATIIFLISTLSGCVIAVGNTGSNKEEKWEVRQEKNALYISQLNLGLSQSLIVADLGTPDFNGAFQRDGEEYQVLYYRTRYVNGDGETTKDETTPLVFLDKRLIGWGEIALEKATR